MSDLLKIANVEIKRDEDGLYCLNDLWRAAGEKEKHRTRTWAKSNQTIDLINAESLNGRIIPFKKVSGRYGGTYANKTLVYDYAMWISPEFKSHVIDVFDKQVISGITGSLDSAVSGIKMSMIDITEKINSASIHFDEVKDCGKSWGQAGCAIRKAKKEAVSQLELLRDEIQCKLDFS